MKREENVSNQIIERRSHSIGKYDIIIENDFMKCRIYWARVIGSETESLFTQYTKHTFYEIQYALEGRIVMQIDKNKTICIEQSDFIIVPPDTFHQIVDGDTVGARFIMAFSLEIKSAQLKNLPGEISKLAPYHETKYMRDILNIAIRKNYHDTPVRRRLITSYLECLMLEFIEATSPYRTQDLAEIESMSENEARIKQIQRFIADHSGIGIRPADISQKFNISERHLNRIFVSETGKTLKETINRHKLAKIEELITTTTLSFKEISELCDFADEYGMNQFFKRYNHCGLTEYRALRAPKA
ncbi:MAG: helix-turn-helix domain-containing protein [Clostridia bacterium]|nr:helix-turn-helix domain-containing protein [Clostridia bacterium]